MTAEASRSEAAIGVDALCARLSAYMPPQQVAEVYRAYRFGARAHAGQQRLSGEPFISHPIAVASILADLRVDYRSIMAAILHDVIEDTPTAKDQLAGEFGQEVADLVDGVSKLTQVHFESRAEAQAENFRKMLLAMADDLRVVLVKLADRLHNMRTLDVMMPAKRRRIARETLDIYAPIANRLGMNSLRHELEELGFAAYYPTRYRRLREAIRRAIGSRKEVFNQIQRAVEQRLREEGIDGEVVARQKLPYSVYHKMKTKSLAFSEILDLYGFRIVVDSIDTCYRVLGAVHMLYKPVPGRFKDYIAIPKVNGYQSLHTVLFGPQGVPVEVQIRTREMELVAESGIAAHWRYKLGGQTASGPQVRAREWLRELIDMQQSAGNSLEFIENVKIDLFPDEVYVFTPKGRIMQLPRGATAVDFAYAVHTDVGNTCVAARIERKLRPLRSVLSSGQTVEIITAQGARPNPAWLDFVITAKARSSIRHYLKNLEHDDAVELGRRLLDKALGAFSSSLDAVPQARVDAVLKQLRMSGIEDLLADIGLGNRMPLMVARRLLDGSRITPAFDGVQQVRPLAIRGTEGMVVNFARCCRPIPGDTIMGFVSSGRGIVVHMESCKNVAEFRKQPEKWIDVQWADDIEGEFYAEVRVDVTNQRGALATIASAIAQEDSNIETVNVVERDGMNSSLSFMLSCRDRQHLARIMRRIRRNPMVLRIIRARG